MPRQDLKGLRSQYVQAKLITLREDDARSHHASQEVTLAQARAQANNGVPPRAPPAATGGRRRAYWPNSSSPTCFPKSAATINSLSGARLGVATGGVANF